MEKPPQPSILTIVEQVYWRGDAAPGAFAAEPSFNRVLTSREPPRQWVLTVGEDWLPLAPPGVTLPKCGQVVVVNVRDRFTRNPTAEQRAESEAKVVEVVPVRLDNQYASECALTVLPGESMRGTFDPARFSIRSRKGTASVIVTFYPG